MRTASEATAAAEAEEELDVEVETTHWPAAEGSVDVCGAEDVAAVVVPPVVVVAPAVVVVPVVTATPVVVTAPVVFDVPGVVEPAAEDDVEDVEDVSAVGADVHAVVVDAAAAGPKTVPATAWVVCVPLAVPPDVLTNTSLSVSAFCQYLGAASMTT